MGISRGTNIVRDGLVFGYDTGYGVADNNTATRFYPGKPTTNLLSSPEAFDDTNYWARSRNSGSVPTVTANTSPNPLGGTYTSRADKVYIPDDGTYPRIAQNFTPASTNTHTFSMWIRSLSGDCRIYLIAFRNSPWNASGSAHKNLTSEWQRVSFSFTPLDASSHQIYMGAHDDAADKGNTLEFWGAHMEENPEATPYEASSRSNTTSLIDLKRTEDISVANASFDSTGQPDFDGTNDYLRVTLSNVDLNSACTIEGVLRRNTTPTAWRTFFNLKPTGSNTPFFEFRSGANAQEIYSDYYNGTDYNTAAGALTTGEFGHAVSCYDGNGNIKMYLNGSLVGTKTGVPAFALGTSPVLSVGIAYSNDRYTDISAPVVKVYNKVLSASEITQNYNAYKKRFNL